MDRQVEEALSTSDSLDSFSTETEGAVGGTDDLKELGMNAENAQVTVQGNNQEAVAGSSQSKTGDVSGFDKLIQEQRNQIMFELRRLQMGDRPVTGQGNREAVADFFTRALTPADEQVISPEENRPEAVTVEVNALVERRPVSAVLQSVSFRRSLENALMGALGNVRGGNEGRPNAASARQRNANQGAVPRSSDRPQVSSRPAPRVRPARRMSSHPAAAAIANMYARRANPATPPPVAARVPPVHVHQPNVSIPAPPMAPPVEEWVQQVPDPEPEAIEEERELSAWEQMEQAQRDDLVEDISELVQRQLVTQALDGDFRPVLERNMSDRLVAIGADGQRVQQFIRSLPNAGVRRNDFSELGIGAMDPSLSDEMSVISATAAVTVNTQANAAMSREMRSLKSQMQELKSMMRLSFDLQLDIQRSIRQEVAAALKETLENTPAPSGSDAQPTRSTRGLANTPVNDDNCLICLDGRCDSVLYQCGHMCVCYPCGLQLRARGSNCPVCRAPIRDIIRAYRSTQTIDQ